MAAECSDCRHLAIFLIGLPALFKTVYSDSQSAILLDHSTPF